MRRATKYLNLLGVLPVLETAKPSWLQGIVIVLTILRSLAPSGT